MELTLKKQTKIYEFRKFEMQESREDEIAVSLCKAQMKAIGTKLQYEDQMVVSAAMIDMIGMRVQNSSTLTIKTVMAKSVVLVTGSNVGKLVDEQIFA